MSNAPTADHVIRVIGGLPVSAVIEATCIWVDGFVERSGVSSMHFMLDVMSGGEGTAIVTARLRHPQSENPIRKVLTPLYNLMAGFHKAGADVLVEGPLAGLLPGAGRLQHDPAHRPPIVGIPPIFQDHLPPGQRLPPLEPAWLAEIFAMLNAEGPFEAAAKSDDFRRAFPTVRRDPQSQGTFQLTHRSGTEVVVLTKGGKVDSHAVEGRQPHSAGRAFCYVDIRPKPARTWGEAWVGFSFGGSRLAPEALEILPDEIAIVHDVEIYRYAIADRTTLADRRRIDFGPGKSAFLSASVWIGMAGQFGENGHFGLAMTCCVQAALMNESPELNARAAEELARWGEWRNFRTGQAASAAGQTPVEPVPVEPLARLVAMVGSAYAEPLREIAGEIARLQWEAESYRRQPDPLCETALSATGKTTVRIAYEDVTGHMLIAAGITPAVLVHLGFGDGPIPPPERYPWIFTLWCGGNRIFGTVASARLVLCDDPTVVYATRL